MSGPKMSMAVQRASAGRDHSLCLIGGGHRPPTRVPSGDQIGPKLSRGSKFLTVLPSMVMTPQRVAIIVRSGENARVKSPASPTAAQGSLG